MKKFLKKNILNSLIRVVVQIVKNLYMRCSEMFPNYFRARRKKNEHHQAYCKFNSESSNVQEKLINKYIRLKMAFVCLIVLFLYISLNNYFIIFIYLKSENNQSLSINEKNSMFRSFLLKVSLVFK